MPLVKQELRRAKQVRFLKHNQLKIKTVKNKTSINKRYLHLFVPHLFVPLLCYILNCLCFADLPAIFPYKYPKCWNFERHRSEELNLN